MVACRKMFNGQRADSNPQKETSRPTIESQKGVGGYRQSSVIEIKGGGIFAIQCYREGK